jgi:hypothetical protein
MPRTLPKISPSFLPVNASRPSAFGRENRNVLAAFLSSSHDFLVVLFPPPLLGNPSSTPDFVHRFQPLPLHCPHNGEPHNMEAPQENTEDRLADVDSGVFENANTITKWLLSQPEDTRPQ